MPRVVGDTISVSVTSRAGPKALAVLVVAAPTLVMSVSPISAQAPTSASPPPHGASANSPIASAVTLSLLTVPTPTITADGGAPTPEVPDRVTRYGLDIVGPDVLQFRPSSEEEAMVFAELLSFALEHPEELGYPLTGATGGTFLIPVTNAQGAALVRDAQLPGTLASAHTVSSIPAHASIARLTEVANEVTALSEMDVPDADLLWKTEPDQINGRIIVTVRQESPALFAALSQRYGDLVAVRIEDGEPELAYNRDDDSPGFYGGAYWESSAWACTTGFAWQTSANYAMLTAAHCISNGGTASWPRYPNAGFVNSGSEENWQDGVGTRYYTGQSTYRGDVALIRLTSYHTAPYIYNGDAHTGTHTGVKRMAPRRREGGDAVCINGVTTGGWCGAVTVTGENVHYILDPGMPWVRNVSEADAIGWSCPTHGDSGAPVYVNRDDGLVDAAGIFSGMASFGFACEAFFTDIYDAYYGLPGSIIHV
jgi:hypothetical protein